MTNAIALLPDVVKMITDLMALFDVYPLNVFLVFSVAASAFGLLSRGKSVAMA